MEQLRRQTEKNSRIPEKQRASDASKDALIKTLKNKLKKVRAENEGLKRQLEVVYGQLSYGREVEQKNNRLKEENALLKNKLYNPPSSKTPKEKVIPFDSRAGISDRILHELNSLNLPLNSTLTKTILEANEEIVLEAVEALKEQMDLEIVKRPGAWLSKAISHGWIPNESIGGIQPEKSFSTWYDLAKAYGVVKSCRQEANTWLVQDTTGEWHSYSEFSTKWTLDYLRSVVKI